MCVRVVWAGQWQGQFVSSSVCVSGLKDALKQHLTDADAFEPTHWPEASLPHLPSPWYCIFAVTVWGPLVSADNSMRLRIESLSSKWKLRQWFMGLYTYHSQSLSHWVIVPLYNYCALLSRAVSRLSRTLTRYRRGLVTWFLLGRSCSFATLH